MIPAGYLLGFIIAGFIAYAVLNWIREKLGFTWREMTNLDWWLD